MILYFSYYCNDELDYRLSQTEIDIDPVGATGVDILNQEHVKR